MATFSSPLFKNLNSLKTNEEKINRAFPVKAVTEGDRPQGVGLFARFAFAGAVCCAITHGAATPIDVVKTRIQLEPETYNKGMITAFRQVVAKDGSGALLTGIGPTIAGYFLQGALKFGGYEFWKKTIIEQVGVETATNNRGAVYLAASGIAEFFADIALCPLEATRIRLVSEPGFATGLVSGFTKIVKGEGVMALYGGFLPICAKQIPYTMSKFYFFEIASEALIKATGKPKDQLTPGTMTSLNLAGGVIAGLAAAFVSQPADTLLSKINKSKALPGETTGGRLIKIAKELGLRGLYGGMTTRFFMIGSLTAGQFAIYGDIKRVLGATQGYELAKV